jgi:hypothetical protein
MPRRVAKMRENGWPNLDHPHRIQTYRRPLAFRDSDPMTVVERVFISSAMAGLGPFDVTWEDLRYQADVCLEQCGVQVLSLEKAAPAPRPVQVVFTNAADDCTSYLGLWGSRYSDGTIDEYLRCLDKRRYIFILDCSPTEVFRADVPNTATARSKLARVEQSLASVTRTSYEVRSMAQLLTMVTRTGKRLVARSRWTVPEIFDPDTFVDRTDELERCIHIVLRPRRVAKVVLVSASSSTGKTALLRKLGYDLSVASIEASEPRAIVDLDGAASPGELIAALLRQLGDADAAIDLLSGAGPAPQRWENELARGPNERLIRLLIDRIAKLVHRQKVAPVVILDDAQLISDGTVARVVTSLVRSGEVAFTLVAGMRRDMLVADDASANVCSVIQDAARTQLPDTGTEIQLRGFRSSNTVRQFFERRGLDRFLDVSARVDELTDWLPGDLAEFAHFLRDGRIESLDPRLFTPESSTVNERRWERLDTFRGDLQVLSIVAGGAPESLLSGLAAKLGAPLRLSEMCEIGAASSTNRSSGHWYRVFPDQFSDFVFDTKLSARTKRRLLVALLREGVSTIKKKGGPELVGLLILAAARINGPSTRIYWSERLGRRRCDKAGCKARSRL